MYIPSVPKARSILMDSPYKAPFKGPGVRSCSSLWTHPDNLTLWNRPNISRDLFWLKMKRLKRKCTLSRMPSRVRLKIINNLFSLIITVTTLIFAVSKMGRQGQRRIWFFELLIHIIFYLFSWGFRENYLELY